MAEKDCEKLFEGGLERCDL